MMSTLSCFWVRNPSFNLHAISFIEMSCIVLQYLLMLACHHAVFGKYYLALFCFSVSVLVCPRNRCI